MWPRVTRRAGSYTPSSPSARIASRRGSRRWKPPRRACALNLRRRSGRGQEGGGGRPASGVLLRTRALRAREPRRLLRLVTLDGRSEDSIRVILVDDHDFFRKGLREL